MPHGLYGYFTANLQACWLADEIDQRARLSNKMEAQGNRWNEVKSDFLGLGLRLDDFEEYFGDVIGIGTGEWIFIGGVVGRLSVLLDL